MTHDRAPLDDLAKAVAHGTAVPRSPVIECRHRPRICRRVVRLLSVLFVCACLGTVSATTIVAQVSAPPTPAPAAAPLDLTRFEKDIVAFEAADRTSPPPQGGILFIGSSIFRQWANLQSHMAPLPVFNRAFGGSRTPEVLHYMDRIVLPYRPRIIVYYCGSNDVNAGTSAETIARNFETFSERVRVALPDTRVYFASIIKAPQKRDRWDVVEDANERVRTYAARTPSRGYIDLHPALESEPGQPRMDLYLPDRLHYRPPAYDRMAAIVRPVIEQAWAEVTGGR